jgi:hypothetical protein
LRCCPPQPVPENHVTSKSRSERMAWGAGQPPGPPESTATVTVDEWTRPRLSVAGTLWMRWPPASASRAATPVPETSSVSAWCPVRGFGSTSARCLQDMRSARRW